MISGRRLKVLACAGLFAVAAIFATGCGKSTETKDVELKPSKVVVEQGERGLTEQEQEWLDSFLENEQVFDRKLFLTKVPLKTATDDVIFHLGNEDEISDAIVAYESLVPLLEKDDFDLETCYNDIIENANHFIEVLGENNPLSKELDLYIKRITANYLTLDKTREDMVRLGKILNDLQAGKVSVEQALIAIGGTTGKQTTINSESDQMLR